METFRASALITLEAPVRALKAPVTLEQIKTVPALKDIALLRQSRLSVMPLSAPEFAAIVALGEAPRG